MHHLTLTSGEHDARRGLRLVLLLLALWIAAIAAPAAAHAAVGDELLTNPGAESGTAGWAPNSWGTNTPTFTQPTTAHTGTRSFRVDVSSYTDGDTKWVPDAVNVTGGQTYKISDWYESNVASAYSVWWERADGTGAWLNLDAGIAASSTWKQYTATFVMPSGAVRAIFVHFIAGKGFLQTDDYSFKQIAPQAGFTRGLVSLTFDDSLTSQWTQAFAPTGRLAAYGFKGTEFVISGTIGQSGSWTSAQITDADTRGHEIGAHTVTHTDLTTLAPASLTTELQQPATTLQNIVGHPMYDLAYPYGSYNDAVLAEVAKTYQGARSVEPGYNTKDNLRALDVVVQNIDNTTTAADVQTWVDQAKANKYWLVIVYHGIDTSNGEFTTTPTKFDQQLSVIRTSAVPVVTMHAALAELLPQVGVTPPVDPTPTPTPEPVPNPNPTPTPTPDRTAPTVTLTTPANGATYGRNSTLVAKYSCADAGSGIKSCTGSVANGAKISTRNRGLYLFTVTAVDKSGNRATKMVYFTVR